MRLGRWSHRVRLDEAVISSRGGATIFGLGEPLARSGQLRTRVAPPPSRRRWVARAAHVRTCARHADGAAASADVTAEAVHTAAQACYVASAACAPAEEAAGALVSAVGAVGPHGAPQPPQPHARPHRRWEPIWDALEPRVRPWGGPDRELGHHQKSPRCV